MMYHKLTVILLCLIFSSSISAQSFETNGALLLKANITLGNQNQWLKLGVASFGTLNYGDVAVEGGLSLFAYQFLKRHTVNTSGLAFQYEGYGLAGIGKNGNLLGSSVSEINSTLLFDPSEDSQFSGIGFGVSQDFLPGKLKSYGVRRGQFIMRFSNATHSAHLVFANDFKFQALRGSGTDFGETGSLRIGFAEIKDPREAYQLGFSVSLFTPQADYGRIPRNPQNSDDGRKNVWFTLPPIDDLFYANIYSFCSYQNESYSVAAKIGLNSVKTGAYIQNKLHDSFGLNPRYPWPVEKADKLYVELGGSLFYNSMYHD